MSNPTLAITMGDPGGIGAEIVLKALKQSTLQQRKKCCVIGAKSVFEAASKRIRIPLSSITHFIDITHEASLLIQQNGLFFSPGRISKANAAFALASIDAAIRLALEGKIKAIVTAPVNKTAIRLIKPHFHGHTEYLAEASRAKKFAMMFVGQKLVVTLVTIHVALKNVSSLIREKTVFEKIELTHQFLTRYCKKKYGRIAVCALNPHGKETGFEDEKHILPAVKRAQAMGMKAVGPLSADQLFHDAYEGRFDAVVSMYHDQGLAPFKMISFRDGVNVTLGLPFVRTSPDHGTAFDIAYQGKADPSSMISSIRLAEKLIAV